MRKLFPLLLLMILLSVPARAGAPRFTWGLEWGYTATFLKTSQHNFICSEGYRIIDNPVTWRYFSNGSVLVNAGADITRTLNLSLYSGIQGVYSKRWVVPAMLRMRWRPGGLDSDGFMVMAGGGPVFPTTVLRETGLESQLGIGYRLALLHGISVDFLLSWNCTLDSERIVDPDTHKYVSRSQMTTNSAEYQAINFSMALNF